MKTKHGFKPFDISISINPKPSNCNECPFQYMLHPEDEGSWYEHWSCFINHERDDWGAAIQRPKGCPLDAALNEGEQK